jgi:hypothetical protein
MQLCVFAATALLAAASALAAVVPSSPKLEARSIPKMVFAHFMVCQTFFCRCLSLHAHTPLADWDHERSYELRRLRWRYAACQGLRYRCFCPQYRRRPVYRRPARLRVSICGEQRHESLHFVRRELVAHRPRVSDRPEDCSVRVLASPAFRQRRCRRLHVQWRWA